MATIKLSTGTFPAQTYATADVMEMARHAFSGIIEAHGGPGSPLHSGLATEACYALAAALIEALPRVANERDLKVMAKDAQERILEYARVFRQAYKDGGRHAIETMGASATPPAGTIQ